ncbi:MAG: peroxidase [Phycisphaerae bacterium]
MAWIKQISDDEAEGRLARIFESSKKRAGRVFNILRVQSQNAESLQAGLGLYQSIMFGESPLTRGQREMMAVVVSRANNCHY